MKTILIAAVLFVLGSAFGYLFARFKWHNKLQVGAIWQKKLAAEEIRTEYWKERYYKLIGYNYKDLKKHGIK